MKIFLKCFVQGVLGVLLCNLSQIRAAEPTGQEIENTGTFLVKLKPGASTSTRRGQVHDDWDFVPLVGTAQVRGEGASAQWWYLAPREGTSTRLAGPSAKPANPWDEAYDLYAAQSKANSRGSNEAKTPLSTRGIGSAQVEFIEPDIGYYRPTAAVAALPTDVEQASPSPNAITGSSQTRHWPQFRHPGDFQEADYSELKEARESVESKLEQSHDGPVRVAFLDTGYDPKHVARPPNINSILARNFVEEKKNPDGISLEQQPGPPGSQSHGTGTIGIFGGGTITIATQDGHTIFSGILGGAPMAEIIPMRVATMVVHLENPLDIPLLGLRPSGTTRAIRYAIKNRCDIISMSHGGLPSKALAEAINDAYDNGIAMFFASGDYLRPPKSPLQSPRYVVFPAAFSRTMCVCGVTADNKTYGEPPTDFNPANGDASSWTLRGNWGPAAWMKNAIAAFSPNIPWAHLPDPKKNETKENVINLDGQGTSASTPQAAAAGTLWLQYYRDDESLKNNWRSWRKAESVYQALKTSAKSQNSDYSTRFFGNGILQAKAALGKRPGDLSLAQQKPAKVGLCWIRLLISTLPAIRRDNLSSNEAMDSMLNLEIAQLATRSIELQNIIEKYGSFDPQEDDPKSIPESANFRKEFFGALRTDPRCSQRLQKVIARALTES